MRLLSSHERNSITETKFELPLRGEIIQSFGFSHDTRQGRFYFEVGMSIQVGTVIGRLAVVNIFRKNNHAWCECLCSCGKNKIVRLSSIKDGYTRSCGCLASERMFKRNYKHGECIVKPSTEWLAWKSIKARCINRHHKSYKDYGGRGITICDRWIGSFENFLLDMGKKPHSKLQIDRINNDGNYEPSNCRWTTAKVNSNNRRKREVKE